MVKPVDSQTGLGWKAETEPYSAASELEFLRWLFNNMDQSDRDALQLRFVQEQEKAVPRIGLI